jgi:hypothetical protein
LVPNDKLLMVQEVGTAPEAARVEQEPEAPVPPVGVAVTEYFLAKVDADAVHETLTERGVAAFTAVTFDGADGAGGE